MSTADVDAFYDVVHEHDLKRARANAADFEEFMAATGPPLIAATVDDRSLRSLGSTAHLGGDLEVRIIACQIQLGPRIVYEVVWTLNGTRHVEWVEECELS